MGNKIETVKGKSRDECIEELNKQYSHYQIVTERAYMEKWYAFWKKTFEFVVMVPEEEKEELGNESIKGKEVKSTKKQSFNEGQNEKKQEHRQSNKSNSTRNKKGSKDDKQETQSLPEPMPSMSQNQNKNNNQNNQAKDSTLQERENKRNELLKKLSQPNGLEEITKKAETHKEEADNNIAELKLMIETLIDKLQEDTGRRVLPLPLEKMESYLKEQEVDVRTARIYVEKAEEIFKDKPVIEDEDVVDNIQKMIENQINVYGPVEKEKTKVVAVVGPTGVGKTTTLAKLGWEFHKNERSVGFITTDTFRSGAKEQLDELAQLMDTEVIVAKGAKELKEAIQYFKNVNQVEHILIDTVGRNPMEDESIEAVKEYLEISNPDLTCLVLSSTSKVKDLKEILARFKSLKIDGLIFTKLDETFNVGSILNVFNFTDLPVVYVTDGQDITKNIYAPTKQLLSVKIMKKETPLEGRVIA